MNAVRLLSFTLDALWKNYRARLKECRTECSEAAVHDLRIAVRRLLVCLKLAQVLVPDAGIQKLRRTLKRQLDHFDELRDIHVMLVEIASRVERFPELGLLKRRLERRERRRSRAAGALLLEFNVRNAARSMSKIKALTAELPEGDVSARILQAVDQSFLKVLRHYEKLEKTRISSFHRVRVLFKKFRYLVESVHSRAPHFPEENLTRMHGYQTRLGKIQDTEVLLQALSDFARREKTCDLELPLRFYERRRAAHISAYLKNRRDVFAFWRATPESSFAWEQKNRIARKSRNREAEGCQRYESCSQRDRLGMHAF